MLTSNERFQKEYKDFSEKISMISDEKVKSDLDQLLQKMLAEARSLDRQHEELLRGSKLASDVVSNHRSSLTAIRQQLVKKIESCESAGLIKE
jgi:hypothetical protein